MTSHELAQQLLAMEDLPVVHHYYFHEGFQDDGMNWKHEVTLLQEGDTLLLTTGDYLE